MTARKTIAAGLLGLVLIGFLWCGFALLWRPVTAIGPDAYAVTVDRGEALFGKGDYDGAISTFTDAIRIRPAEAQAYRCRGDAERRAGETDKAIADCTEAIRLDPKYGEAYETPRAGFSRIWAISTRRSTISLQP